MWVKDGRWNCGDSVLHGTTTSATTLEFVTWIVREDYAGAGTTRIWQRVVEDPRSYGPDSDSDFDPDFDFDSVPVPAAAAVDVAAAVAENPVAEKRFTLLDTIFPGASASFPGAPFSSRPGFNLRPPREQAGRRSRSEGSGPDFIVSLERTDYSPLRSRRYI
jgi:hypothetical protein